MDILERFYVRLFSSWRYRTDLQTDSVNSLLVRVISLCAIAEARALYQRRQKTIVKDRDLDFVQQFDAETQSKNQQFYVATFYIRKINNIFVTRKPVRSFEARNQLLHIYFFIQTGTEAT